MAGPPARCLNPKCHFVFELSNLFGGSGTATNIVLTGNRTNCPRCGAVAEIGDGVYQYSDGQILLKGGPPLTWAMANKLAEIAQAAKMKTIDAEELLAEVAGVSPELAQKLRGHGLTYFAIVLLLLWLIKSVSLQINVDLNELINQVQGETSECNDASVLDRPVPELISEPKDPPNIVIAAQEPAPMSRQVRRRLERQSRRANRPTRRNNS